MTISYVMPVKNVLKMINSCQTYDQIEDCKIMINDYIKFLKNKGLININELKLRLIDELIQKEENIYLSNTFNF